MKKEYVPMALGFWGVGLPLLVFGLVLCRTTGERITVILGSALFLLVGRLIARAKP